MTAKVLVLRKPEPEAREPSDVQLMAACATGQSAALGALFDRYQQDVYRFLGRLAGTRAHELDDLVQETFLELQRSAGHFEGRAHVKTWIFGIAVNVARHHARSEWRRRLFGLRLATLPSEAPQSADATAIAQQNAQRLGRAMDALSHDLRTAFVMCDLEGMSGVEVARTLAIPEGTVFRRLHDARKKLRTLLEENPV